MSSASISSVSKSSRGSLAPSDKDSQIQMLLQTVRVLSDHVDVIQTQLNTLELSTKAQSVLSLPVVSVPMLTRRVSKGSSTPLHEFRMPKFPGRTSISGLW